MQVFVALRFPKIRTNLVPSGHFQDLLADRHPTVAKFEPPGQGSPGGGWVRNPGVQCNPATLRPGTRGIHGEDALGPWVRRGRGLEIKAAEFLMEPRRRCPQ